MTPKTTHYKLLHGQIIILKKLVILVIPVDLCSSHWKTGTNPPKKILTAWQGIPAPKWKILYNYTNSATLFRSDHRSSNAGVDYCVWVKKYSVLYLSSGNLDVILLFFFRLYLNLLILLGSLFQFALLILICLLVFLYRQIFFIQANWAKELRDVKHGCGRMSRLFPASSQLSGDF